MKAWAEQFYNSDAWRACREAFLQSKGYLCERCSTPDNPVVAKIAHHKIYLTKENINNPYMRFHGITWRRFVKIATTRNTTNRRGISGISSTRTAAYSPHIRKIIKGGEYRGGIP